jgi:hypothetical protein
MFQTRITNYTPGMYASVKLPLKQERALANPVQLSGGKLQRNAPVLAADIGQAKDDAAIRTNIVRIDGRPRSPRRQLSSIISYG